jgi:hypothetical protein
VVGGDLLVARARVESTSSSVVDEKKRQPGTATEVGESARDAPMTTGSSTNAQARARVFLTAAVRSEESKVCTRCLERCSYRELCKKETLCREIMGKEGRERKTAMVMVVWYGLGAGRWCVGWW